MSKTNVHKPLDSLIISSENKTEESFLDITFHTKEKFDKLELKRNLFNRMFPVKEKLGFYMNQKI